MTTARWHPAKTLDIDVDELAGSFADVADRYSGQLVGVCEPAQAVSTQDAIDGRARMTKERTELVGPYLSPPSNDQDPADLTLGQRPWPRSGRAERSSSPADAFGPGTDAATCRRSLD